MKTKKRALANTQEPPESYRKILHYFFAFPQQSIGLNDLAKKTNTAKTSAKIAVTKLITEGFLKKEVIGKTWRISADPKSTFVITKKIPYNLELIYASGIIARVYEQIANARAILLFGSYRWGTDNEQSDIDVAVEVLGRPPLRILPFTIDVLGFREKITVNLHLFSRSNIDLNVFTNIANGIVLDGLLEIHP